MQRLFKFFLPCFVLCFIFTGCFFDDPEQENQFLKTTTVQTHPSKTVYLNKINKGRKIVSADNTGTVRSAVDNQLYSSLPLTQNELDSANFTIQQKNEEFLKNAAQQIELNAAGRAAGGENPVETGINNTIYTVGSERSFYSYIEHKGSGLMDGTEDEVEAVCKFVGDNCYIFADKSDTYISDDEIYKTLGQKFEKCYPLVTQYIGDPKYESYNSNYFVPCNQKIYIFVSDLYRDGNKGNILGYFYNRDLYKTSVRGAENSNQCEMFYIDSYYLANKPEQIYSTLVHEFNHMINFKIKSLDYMTINYTSSFIPTCQTWFTEMLAMTTEDLFTNFLQTPEGQEVYSLRLPYFDIFHNYGHKNWSNYTVSEYPQISCTSIMYANSYAFGAYLVRNFGGLNLLKQIAQNEYVNEDAITKALQTCNPSWKYKDYDEENLRNIDYAYALKMFCHVMLNTDEPDEEQMAKTGDKFYFSMNRESQSDSSEPTLKFNKINLKIPYFDSSTNTSGNYAPVIRGYNSNVNIGPDGFSLHKIGTGLSSFTLVSDTRYNIKYLLIQK